MEEQYLKSLELNVRQSKGILEAIGFFLFYTTVTAIIGILFGVAAAVSGEGWAFAGLAAMGIAQLIVVIRSVLMFSEARQGDQIVDDVLQDPGKFYDCKKCGKQPEPGHDYCTNCGTRLEVRL